MYYIKGRLFAEFSDVVKYARDHHDIQLDTQPLSPEEEQEAVAELIAMLEAE